MKKNKVIYKTYRKDRIIRPRIEGGCDWGAERIVLVRKGDKELFWRKACKSWASLLDGYRHDPAALMLCDHSNLTSGVPKEKTLHNTGGRLSKRLIMDHAEEIDKFFGEETATFVDIKLTLLLKK
jgi:hypothetical protein